MLTSTPTDTQPCGGRPRTAAPAVFPWPGSSSVWHRPAACPATWATVSSGVTVTCQLPVRPGWTCAYRSSGGGGFQGDGQMIRGRRQPRRPPGRRDQALARLFRPAGRTGNRPPCASGSLPGLGDPIAAMVPIDVLERLVPRITDTWLPAWRGRTLRRPSRFACEITIDTLSDSFFSTSGLGIWSISRRSCGSAATSISHWVARLDQRELDRLVVGPAACRTACARWRT